MTTRAMLSEGGAVRSLRPLVQGVARELGWAAQWRDKGRRQEMRTCAASAARGLKILRRVLTVAGPADGREIDAHYQRMRNLRGKAA
jgi:hypothetical protein